MSAMKRSTGNRRLVVVACSRRVSGPVPVRTPAALTAVRVPVALKKPDTPSDSDELPPAA